MTRPGGYGSVGGRRGGSAIWQWLLLGLLFGIGCAAIFVLTLLTLNILTIGETEPEQVTVQITSPPDAAAVQGAVDAGVSATLQSLSVAQEATVSALVDATIEAVAAEQDAVLVAPTNTPADQNTVEAEATTEAETTEEGGTGGGAAGNTTDTGAQSLAQATEEAEPEIDPNLAQIISPVVNIQGGTFMMGTTPNEIAIAVRECTQRDNANCVAADAEDSIPQHEVTVNDFAIEVTEVTNEQFIAYLNSLGPGSHTDGCSGRLCVATNAENENSSILYDGLNYAISDPSLNNLPVVTVTWFGAQTYCQSIGRRLLTEAEWEYAARGPEGNLYPWGQQWTVGSVDGTQRARTNRPDPDNIGVVEVRTYEPLGDTANGISDMAGNAAEWVFDWYAPNFYETPQATGTDPTGPATAREKVLRGGSWAAVPFFARTVHRQSSPPDATEFWIGFRCGDDIEAETPGADGNLEGLGDLPETGTGPDTEAEPTENIDARPTVPSLDLPATEAPAVPPAQPGG